MISFEPLREFKPGLIAGLLYQSYEELLNTYPNPWVNESKKWDKFDKEAFGNMNTVGKCVFVTCLSGMPIGFGSYDPRQKPEYAIIGHNCIIPEHRRRGYGKAQVIQLLNLFRVQEFKKVRVTTSEHSFFIPAQKMYRSCGFIETQRFKGGSDSRFKIVKFEKRPC